MIIPAAAVLTHAKERNEVMCVETVTSESTRVDLQLSSARVEVRLENIYYIIFNTFGRTLVTQQWTMTVLITQKELIRLDLWLKMISNQVLWDCTNRD